MTDTPPDRTPASSPNPDPTPSAGPALPPCALNVRDAEELVAVLSHWRSVPADSPVRILADTAPLKNQNFRRLWITSVTAAAASSPPIAGPVMPPSRKPRACMSPAAQARSPMRCRPNIE